MFFLSFVVTHHPMIVVSMCPTQRWSFGNKVDMLLCLRLFKLYETIVMEVCNVNKRTEALVGSDEYVILCPTIF